MDSLYKVLESDMELLAAALSGVKVAVVLKNNTDELLEPGGQIRAYSPKSVRIRGLFYNRDLHEFRILREGPM